MRATGDRREQLLSRARARRPPRAVKLRAIVKEPRLRVVEGASSASFRRLVSPRVVLNAARALLAVIRLVLGLPILPPRNLARSFKHLGANRTLFPLSVGMTILWAANLPTEVLTFPVRSIRRHTDVRTPALEKPAAVTAMGVLLEAGEVSLVALLLLES